MRQARVFDDVEEVVDHRISGAGSLDGHALLGGEEQLELDRETLGASICSGSGCGSGSAGGADQMPLSSNQPFSTSSGTSTNCAAISGVKKSFRRFGAYVDSGVGGNSCVFHFQYPSVQYRITAPSPPLPAVFLMCKGHLRHRHFHPGRHC